MVRFPRLILVLIVLTLTAGCLPSAASAAGGSTATASAAKKAKSKSAKAKARGKAKRHAVKRRVRRKPAHSPPAPSAVTPSTSPAASAPVISTCGTTTGRPATDADAATLAAVLCLVNNERARAGLEPLVRNDALDSAAQFHSRDMVAQQYFDHTDPLGVGAIGRVLAAGWVTLAQSWRIGENIAWGSGPYASPRSAVLRWMNSPPHRENMLNPAFREIGVGVAAGTPMPQPEPGATYTIELGVRG